jgi:hypothetical protein
MRDDDGHPLGNIASVDHRSGRAPGRISRHGHVRGANASLRGWKLGALPGLYRGRPVVGVRTREREWGRRGADVGHAHWPSPSDASGAHRSRDLSPIRRDSRRQWKLGQIHTGVSTCALFLVKKKKYSANKITL